MASNPNLFVLPKVVTVDSGGRVSHLKVPPNQPLSRRIELTPRDGVCRVEFVVNPATVLTMPRGSAPRPFGLQFFFP